MCVCVCARARARVRVYRACVRACVFSVLSLLAKAASCRPPCAAQLSVCCFAVGVFLGERVIVCCDYFHSIVLWPAFTSVMKSYVLQWRPKQPIKEHIIIITTVFVCPESVAPPSSHTPLSLPFPLAPPHPPPLPPTSGPESHGIKGPRRLFSRDKSALNKCSQPIKVIPCKERPRGRKDQTENEFCRLPCHDHGVHLSHCVSQCCLWLSN